MDPKLRASLQFGNWLLAVLLTILALRFATVAVMNAFTPEPSKPATASKQAPGARAPRRAATAASGSLSVAPPPKAGPRIRVMLSVTLGEQRSEVYVNGDLQGLTPYAGDVSCQRGEAISVQIVPNEGPLIERKPICQGSMIRITQ